VAIKSRYVPDNIINAYLKFCELTDSHADDETENGIALREASKFYCMDDWMLWKWSTEVPILFLHPYVSMPPRNDPELIKHERVFVKWMREELGTRKFLLSYMVTSK
jgi:hypothetical protein